MRAHNDTNTTEIPRALFKIQRAQGQDISGTKQAGKETAPSARRFVVH